MRKILLSVSLIYILIVTVSILSVAIFYYTPAPLIVLKKLLPALTVRIDGPTGSLSTRIHIDRISFGGDENYFELDDFSLSYGGLWDYLVKHEINIPELKAGRLFIRAKTSPSPAAMPSTRINQPPAPVPSVAPSASAAENRLGPEKVRRVHIGRIDISNLEFDLSHLKTPIQIQKLQVLNLHMDHGAWELEKFLIDSNVADVSLDLKPGSPEINMTLPPSEKAFKVVLKPTYLKALKAPISLSGRLNWDPRALESTTFSLVAFENKATLQLNEDRVLKLELNDLKLSDYLTEPPYIQRFSISASLRPELTRSQELKVTKGEFYIGAAKMTIQPATLHIDSDEMNQIRAKITASTRIDQTEITAEIPLRILEDQSNSNQGAIVEPVKIKLSSNPRLSDEDVFARLLFYRPYLKLKTAEKAQLKAEKNHFLFE